MNKAPRYMKEYAIRTRKFNAEREEEKRKRIEEQNTKNIKLDMERNKNDI